MSSAYGPIAFATGRPGSGAPRFAVRRPRLPRRGGTAERTLRPLIAIGGNDRNYFFSFLSLEPVLPPLPSGLQVMAGNALAFVTDRVDQDYAPALHEKP